MRAQFFPDDIMKMRKMMMAKVNAKTKLVKPTDAIALTCVKSMRIFTSPNAIDAHRRFTALLTA